MAHVEAGGGGAAAAAAATASTAISVGIPQRPITDEQLRAAILNRDNKYVSIHSGPPQPGVVMDEHGLLDKEKTDLNFITLVPPKTIVILFTPHAKLAESSCYSEEKMREFLKQSDWFNPHSVADRGLHHALLSEAKVYFPGDKVYNQSMVFDDRAGYGYFDIFNLFTGVPIDSQHFSGHHRYEPERVSALKKKLLQPVHTAAVKAKQARLRSVVMKNQPVEYKHISTRDLLENLVRGREGTRQETSSPYNIIYIYSCNPETSITDIYDAYEEGEAGGGGGGGGAVPDARRERRLVRTMEKGVPEAFLYVEALRVELMRQGRENFNKVQHLMVPGLRHAPSRMTSTSRAAAASAAGTFFGFDPTQDAEEERFEGEEILYTQNGTQTNGRPCFTKCINHLCKDGKGMTVECKRPGEWGGGHKRNHRRRTQRKTHKKKRRSRRRKTRKRIRRRHRKKIRKKTRRKKHRRKN